ncbi:hypothetical protein sos41_40310 [Alphaproteobacteria bacterium SO-S41]|nr:hypothetical protein sos41_40310 [Alphaproteobacteria bacterium SO-S41]
MSPNNDVPTRGLWLRRHTSDLGSHVDWTRHVIDAIIDGVLQIKGSAAADVIAQEGVGVLHTVIDARDVGRLRDLVIDRLRNEFLTLAAQVGRAILGWRNDFFVDDYLILRINFPYETARRSDPSAENPGIGRVTASVRAAAQARRVIDPTFNPKEYHKGHPPAAWAHGPHRDSWAGHSLDGINIWWAISDVPAHAGMVLYEGLDDVALPSDPRSGYIRAGYPLPAPTYAPLSAGEMLVFDPEILHGTHLNLSDQTRVAVSMRINATEPKFDPVCFYAREFWRRAAAIEANSFDEVLHLKREDNLAATIATLPKQPMPRPAPLPLNPTERDQPIVIGPSSLVEDGSCRSIVMAEQEILLVRVDGDLRAFDSACPHYGVSLADGALENGILFCPGCGIGFDTQTGQCRSSLLTLRRFEVAESDGVIKLELSDPPPPPA